jgi:hypothetical protein
VRTAEQTLVARLWGRTRRTRDSPANMACLGAAQACVLERVIGRDEVPFEVTWIGATAPTVTRANNGFRQLADEGGLRRIWAASTSRSKRRPASVHAPGWATTPPTT